MSEIVVPTPERPYLGPTPPEVIAAIMEALAAADATAGAFVNYGLMAELPDNRERIYLLGVTGYRRASASPAHRVRVEEFQVRGLVEVQTLGTEGGSHATAARAWELLDAVDATLQAEPDLEVARYRHELSVPADELVPTTDGWLARIVFGLLMGTHR